MKPVLSGHSEIDETKVLKTGGSLVQVKSIAECSGAFCKTFDLHEVIFGIENILGSIFVIDRLRQVLLYTRDNI